MTAGRRVASPSPGGQANLAPVHAMENVSYIERTDRIEARLCRNFGITVRVRDDIPKVLPRSLRVRVLHPQFTRPDGRTSTEDRFSSAVVNGLSHIGFSFDHEWEMQPGDWTIVVSAGGSELARKAFTVSLPPPGSSNSDCGVS